MPKARMKFPPLLGDAPREKFEKLMRSYSWQKKTLDQTGAKSSPTPQARAQSRDTRPLMKQVCKNVLSKADIIRMLDLRLDMNMNN